MQLNRRDFLKAGIAGLAAATVARYGKYLNLPVLFSTEAEAHELTGAEFVFSAREVLLENVDRTLTYHWAWQSGHDAPSIAGPTLILELGVPVSVTIFNTLSEPHGWAVTDRFGGYLANSGPIAPGGQATVNFTPLNPGTYLYLDPENAPVNRVMGLFGGIVVNPVTVPAEGAVTPYSGGLLPVPLHLQELFDSLGTTAYYPGEPWDPNNWNLWLFGSIDPAKNLLVQQLAPGEVISPAAFLDGYRPRYFYINGRQGYFAAHDSTGHQPGADPHTDHPIDLVGPAGRPRLIRNVNVGLSTHSPHIHANHGFSLFESDVAGVPKNVGIQENVIWMDTWTMKPMNHKDVLYCFIKPPDIPDDTWARLLAGTSEEGFPENPMHLDENGVFQPGFPMFYPMHCHLELSQTSGGGNYPQGMVTHIQFTGSVEDA